MDLLRLTEAAERIGVSAATLKQWIYKGKLRSVRTPGGHHRIPRSEVQRLAGSRRLAWVSQTAANIVVGYDLATGIPVEKVRYPTVQQPNSLAFDDASDTLYVVSGSGAGVQVIRDAAGAR